MRRIYLIICVFCLFVTSIQAQNFSFERYLNIRSSSAPSFSPDGYKIAFLTNITGTSQVWLVDSRGGYPEQITAFQDNVSFVKFFPDGKKLLFGKASGGDENTQFFTYELANGTIRALTESPKIRHNFGAISADGKKIYYASNKRDRNFFDIYAMDAESGKEEILYQNDGANSFAAASPDGSKIIVSRSGTEFSLDNNLYLIETATKKETLLTPHEGAAQFGDVHFADNNTLLLATNKDREFYNLARMNLRTKKIEMLNNINWDTDATAVSDDGMMFAHTFNREGFSELYFTETKNVSLKSSPIKLPANGVVGGIDFSKDNSKIAFTFNSSKYNSDIWVYHIGTRQLTQITRSSTAGIPSSTFIEPQLISYKTFDGRNIPAWFYKPTNASGKFPVIISVHGGPEAQERPNFNPLYQYYLSRGYAVLATNVRGSTGYGKSFAALDNVRKREDAVKDLAYSVEWLKANGADAKRIAVTGGSYGGYMTMAAITLYPDLFAAAVNTVGIVNWETFLKNTSGYRRRQREVEYGFLDRDLDFLRQISPIAKVDRIKTPLMVVHGKNDPRVPYTEAEQIVEALRKRGAIVEYKLFDDEGHGISKLKNRLVLFPQVANFLDKYMKDR